MLWKIWFHTILFRWGKRILLWSHFRFPPNSNLSQKGAFLFKSPERYCSRHPPLPCANNHIYIYIYFASTWFANQFFQLYEKRKEDRLCSVYWWHDRCYQKRGLFQKKKYKRFWKLVHFHYFTPISKIGMKMSTF